MVCRIFICGSCETALEKNDKTQLAVPRTVPCDGLQTGYFSTKVVSLSPRNRKSNENVGMSTPQHLKRIVCTVEPPVRDQPKGGDLVVAYGGWLLIRFEP